MSSMEERIRKRREEAAQRKLEEAAESGNADGEQLIAPLTDREPLISIVKPTEVLLHQTPGHKQDTDSIVIPVASIDVPDTQSRSLDNPGFTQSSVRELADDMREHGQDTAIQVTLLENGRYLLHAGSRRMHGKKDLIGRFPLEMEHRNIRATLKSYSDENLSLLRHLAENIQREGLTPLEEAQAFFNVKNSHGLTDQQLSEKIFKSRTYVTRRLQLLKLSDDVKTLIKHNVVGCRAALKGKGKVVDEYVKTLPVSTQEQISQGEVSLEDVFASSSVIEEQGKVADLPPGSQSGLSDTAEVPAVKKVRSAKISIPLESATSLCDLLIHLCEKHGITPIELPKQKGKYVRKDMLAVLEARAGDVLRVVMDESASK
jgi:ParB/RepB/Spo0J family partition protein